MLVKLSVSKTHKIFTIFFFPYKRKVLFCMLKKLGIFDISGIYVMLKFKGLSSMNTKLGFRNNNPLDFKMQQAIQITLFLVL